MTLNELRDEAARLLGWTHGRDCDPAIEGCPPAWAKSGCRSLFHGEHPVPPTLDGIAALWREHLPGWEWYKAAGPYDLLGHWWAFHRTNDPPDGRWTDCPAASKKKMGVSVSIPNTGDELFDRLALFVAALKSERSKP